MESGTVVIWLTSWFDLWFGFKWFGFDFISCDLICDLPITGATLWGVRDNVRTSFIAHWKARGRLPIRDNWTFFASSYGSDFISRYWSKSEFFEGGGSLSANFRWKGTTPTNLCWHQKTGMITLLCGIKTSAVCAFVSSQSTRDGHTGGRTDRITIPKTALT